MADVVKVARETRGIALVEMADRATSNALSMRMIDGLVDAFADLARDESIRAVVLHGYDAIFSTGATRMELEGIVNGTVEWQTDARLYRLLIDHPLPVVAAMQGHALGGGFILGLYGDVVLLAEESLYSTNFVDFGFTPGGGATLIAPDKLGPNIANEMLLSGRGLHGGELRARGVPLTVVKRKDVIPTATRLAAEIASKPRATLTLLKHQLTARIIRELPDVIRRELEAQRVAVAQQGVLERIEGRFR